MQKSYLVLSDLHLTKRFEKGKEAYLTNLIKKYKNIVLNGDFYEAMLYSKQDLIKAGYGKLFKLLKSKNTYYLPGNHDPVEYSKPVAESFSSNIADFVKLNLGGFKYHIEHGHLLCRNEKKPNPLRFKIKYYLFHPIQKYLPVSTFTVGSLWNRKVLKSRHLHPQIKDDEILVCGHTHVKVFDLKKKYVDLGRTQFGSGNYAVIDEKGIKMVSFKY